MKKLLLLIALVFFMAPLAINAQDTASQNDVAKIVFKQSEQNFGDINQGDVIETKFIFVNEGTVPLVLTNVSTTCGCTAPSWPREAIQPGQQQEIQIRFNSAGKMGLQNKVITVYSNAVNNPEKVKIVANVLKPSGAQSSSNK